MGPNLKYHTLSAGVGALCQFKEIDTDAADTE